MSTLITHIKRIALALCLATPFVSWAVTPVAVWDGDFSTMTKGTYTLSENGNTKESGYLQVSGDNGILLTSTAALNNFTVIARCEGLNLGAEKAQVLFTSYANDTVNDNDYRNLTGVNLPTNNAGCRGIWSCADWNNDEAEQGSVPANYTTLIYNHQQSNGTYAYALGPTSDVDDTVVRTTLYSVVGLRSSGTTYKGFAIGGLRGTTSESLLPATGLKITSLAVFSGTLSEAEMKEYSFPSEVPVFNVTVSEDKTWSEVLSAAGVTDAENSKLVITAENDPKITFDVTDSVLYGLTVNGSAVFSAGDAVYGSGAQSFGKTLLSTSMDLSLPNVTFEVKDGWKGAFVTSASDLKFYAQNAETISINIGGGTGTADTSDGANLVSGSEYYGLYPTPGSAWNNISGRWQSSKTVTLTSAKAFDGETTTTRNTIQLSGTSGNTWQWTGTSVPFLRGYLDDTAGIQVQIVGVPYSQYDVIIYATSDSSLALNYFTINGTGYTCGSDGIATEGTSSWGVGQTTTPTLGKNAMLVQGVTGSTLTISGTRAASNPRVRVTVCAVQIINKGVVESSDWSANLDATTTFSGGIGAGLSGQSGTWVNSALASITVTNKASDATLTLDGEITAGSLKIVGDEGKRLTVAKDPGATLDIAIYDLTESEEETTFLFDPDFSKVNAGSNLIGVGFNYEGTIASGRHYTGSENVLTLATVSGGEVNVGGAGTISGDLDISDDATVVFDGNYTSSGNVMLGATKGELNIAEGASVSVPHVRLVNSSSSVACTMNVNGALTVTSESSNSNVYNERNDYKGILFGHWSGNSTVNVGSKGSIRGESAWMQLTYTAPNTLTVDGGSVKVRGINGGAYSNANSPLTLTGGGVIEVAEGFVNMGYITRNYGYGTIKTYSYNSSTGWTDPGAITFTDTTNGTTIDPCGMADVFSGALSGAGKIVVSDSVGGGSVSFTGASNNLTGDIVVDSGATLNLGVTRPTGTLTVDGVVSITLATKADVPVLKVSAEPAANSIKLYDIDGETEIEANVTYDSVAGTVTVRPPVNTWTVSDDCSFDTDANWTRGLPTEEQDIAINVSGDAVLTISSAYTAATLTISGQGVVELEGNGAITVETLYLAGGATFMPKNANVMAQSFVLDSGTILRIKDTVVTAPISGAGAVETYGMVVLGNANTMTGGITVKPGSRLSASVPGAYGEYQSGWAYTAQRQVVVEDGGTVDINNIANNDSAVALTIAGKGVMTGDDYAGAVIYSGSGAVGSGSRQISSLVLAGDAMVDVGAGWGLVHSGWGNARLGLNGHTLTVRGLGTFPVVNANNASGAATTGTIVLDGATLELSNAASNLEGVNIVADGCETINLATAPSALGSLTIKPSASGTTATNWNHPVGLVPVVDVSNIDYANLANDQELTLFTAPAETTLSASTINARINGRYTTTIEDNTVKATYHAGTPTNFLHYNFDEGVAVNTGKASDSGTQISSVGEASDDTLVDSRNGKAVQVHTGYTPYWGSYVANLSPFHAGEVTVTTVAKMNETGVVLWGLGGAADNLAVGLVVEDANTAKVVAKRGTSTIETLATATVAEDLTSGWHFFAVVSDENGTTLYVDDNTPASSDTGILASIGQQGQLGSFHGGAFGAKKVGADGYYLDDWRVYDTALTAEEVADIQDVVNPKPLITIASTDNGTVSVVAADQTYIASGSRVAKGTTITVTITPAWSYKDDEITITMGGVDITETVAAAEGTFEVTDDVSITVTFVPDVVSFTVEAVANTTVKVMEGASEVTPENGVYSVNPGAQVQVIWEGAEGYSVTGGTTAWFTPSANQVVAAPTGMVINEVAARIFDTTYATLKDAVDAATAYGAEVVLLKDVTLTERIEPNPGGSSMTINLNGHKITREGTGGNGSAFDVKSGTVTIKNGTIDCTQDDTAIVADGVYAITARAGSTVTLEDLNVTVNSECGACVYPFANNMGGIVQVARVYIKSGTYLNTTTTPYRYRPAWTGMSLNQANKTSTSAVNTGGIATQMIFVSGGTFGKVDPELGDDSWTEGEGTFIDGTAPASYIAVPNSDGTYTVRAGTWVAKVGDTKFESLDEAVAAAKVSGEQVIILKDHPTGMAEPLVVSEPVTVNANGHLISTPTVTVAGGYIIAPEQSFLGADTWIVETVEQEQFSRIVKYGYGATHQVTFEVSAYGTAEIVTGYTVLPPDYYYEYYRVKDGTQLKVQINSVIEGYVPSGSTITVGEVNTPLAAPVAGAYTVTITANAKIKIDFARAGIDPTKPESTQEVVIDPVGKTDEQIKEAAIAAATVTVPEGEVANTGVDADTYKEYFNYTVTDKGNGVYEVALNPDNDLNETIVLPEEVTVGEETIIQSEELLEAATNAEIEEAEVPAVPGIYYSMVAADNLGFADAVEGDQTLATGRTVTIAKPTNMPTGNAVFFRVKASATPNN